MFNKFAHGMTVRDLKNLLRDWPEVRENGDLTEVWMTTGKGTSSQVKIAVDLNLDSTNASDIIFYSEI